MEVRLGNLTFTSKFDSGNLARVEKVSKEEDEEVCNANVNHFFGELKPDAEFNLWTKPDCAGSPAENSNRSWFYFGVRGWVPNRLMKFNIMNMNRQGKLYSQGHAPLTRILPSRPKWERIRDKPTFEVIDSQFILTFTYRFPDLKGGTCYFAFSYPWSYTESQEQLAILDKRFEHCLHMSRGSPPESLYYHRELLCYSLDKLRVDLVTITSCHGNTFCRETRFDKHLFPDQDTPRCYKFKDKRVFLLSSRVHPGETPGSFVFNGFLDFILRENDLRAARLRQQYVFKLIPMLNPDGVMRGHYRTDQRGMNLNRMYLDPSPLLHPSIYAAKSLLVYHHVMNQLPRLGGQPLNIDINFPCGQQNSGQDGPDVKNSPQERSGGDQDAFESDDHYIPLSSDSPRQTTRRQNLTESHQHPLVSVSLKHVTAIQSDNSERWLEADIPGGGTTSLELLSQQESAKVEPLNLGDLYMSDESASDCCPPAGLEDNKIFHVSSSSSSIVSLDKLHMPATGTANGQAEMHHVDSELCLHLSELNMSEDLCSNTLAEDGSFDYDTEVTERLGNEGSEDEEASPATLEGLSGNCSPHLSDARLLEIHPHDSGVAFYMDLHGHASKRGCFIYGNYFDNEEIQLENILYAKLIALNSAHFDFGACNFSERNMYLKDKRDGFSKEGSGRVAIYKAIGIIHSYTLECNYNMGRLVNPVPPAFKDDGRATPPPLAGFPPKFTQAHYEEVGRAVAVAVLDMTETNPWSRVTQSEHNSIHGLRDWVRRYLRSLRGGPRIPRNPSLKSMNKNGNNGLPGKSDSTPVQNSTRVPAGRVVGVDPSSRASVIRQTSQNSATTGRRELAPVKEVTRYTTFSSVRTQMRRHSSTSSSPPKLSSLSGPTLPVPPVQTHGNSEQYSMMMTSSTAADTKVMRHFSADSTLRLQEEDKVQQLKNCSLVAIARRGGPPSRIPLPTSQSRLTLTAQANSLSDAGLTGKVLSKTAVLWQTQPGTSNLSPVREKTNFAFLESVDASLSRTLPASLLQPTMQSQPLAQLHIGGCQVLQASASPPSPTSSQAQTQAHAQEAQQPSRAVMSLAGVPSLFATPCLFYKDQQQPPTGLKFLAGVGESKSDIPKSRRRYWNVRRRTQVASPKPGVTKGQNKGGVSGDGDVEPAKAQRRKRRGPRRPTVANEAAVVGSPEMTGVQEEEMAQVHHGKAGDTPYVRLTPRIITLSMTHHQYSCQTQLSRFSAANRNNTDNQMGHFVGDPNKQIEKPVDEC